MAFGGLLYEERDQQRFVILTTKSDTRLADIHQRAPLILSSNYLDAWMGGNAATAEGLLKPAPSRWFKWYRVGVDVGKVSNDHPALVKPLNDNELCAEEMLQGDLFS